MQMQSNPTNSPPPINWPWRIYGHCPSGYVLCNFIRFGPSTVFSFVFGWSMRSFCQVVCNVYSSHYCTFICIVGSLSCRNFFCNRYYHRWPIFWFMTALLVTDRQTNTLIDKYKEKWHELWKLICGIQVQGSAWENWNCSRSAFGCNFSLSHGPLIALRNQGG